MRIQYNSETKTFGIISNRVRKILLDHYEDEYGKDSDKYKDFKERKELLDELESREDEGYRPYGYAPSSRRTLNYEFMHNRSNLPQGFTQSDYAMRSGNRDIINKRDFKSIQSKDSKDSKWIYIKINQIKSVN